LSFDVEFYAKKLLAAAEDEISRYYPSNKQGNKPIVYYWVKEAICSNPSCHAKVPLLKHFYISKRRSTAESNWVHFKPEILDKEINLKIGYGKNDDEGWNNRGNLKCPLCGNITSVKEIKDQSKTGILKDKLIAVIEETSSGKLFRSPTPQEISVIDEIPHQIIPNEKIHKNSAGGDTLSWGITTWGRMFSQRQLLVSHTLIKIKNTENFFHRSHDSEYKKALHVYLTFLINRILMRNSRHNTWHLHQDTIEKVFGRQAISMVFDYPEMYPFSKFTSSAIGQLSQITDYIANESRCFNVANCENATSGDKSQFKEKEIDVVVTDPPYYDAIAYADLSDFFYIWMKRTLSEEFPLNFSTPQTPKSEECTALKHHHNESYENAKNHFENKLHQIFSAIESQTKDLVSIMFAHQSTEAWTTLCNSILNSNMNITGSWAVETENTAGLKQDKAFLSSSVTVSCIPSQTNGTGDYKTVKAAIKEKVAAEVEELYKLGFRGADLLTACFGQAVSEFGKYEKVEKADGSEVTVAELLEMARESAFNALLRGFDGDDFTKFYIGWLQLNGFTESDYDDAMRIVQVGLSIGVQEVISEHLLLKKGSKIVLANCDERNEISKNLGEKREAHLIDKAHKLMKLYKGTHRTPMLRYIAEHADSPDSVIWRVITSLDELLPKDCDDHKMTRGLLTNKDNLIKESQDITEQTEKTGTLEF